MSHSFPRPSATTKWEKVINKKKMLFYRPVFFISLTVTLVTSSSVSGDISSNVTRCYYCPDVCEEPMAIRKCPPPLVDDVMSCMTAKIGAAERKQCLPSKQAENFCQKYSNNNAKPVTCRLCGRDLCNDGTPLILRSSHFAVMCFCVIAATYATLDKYLAVDSFGNVTCENEEKEPGSKFQISVSEDGSGRWAFRNVVRGYFLGASSDKLTCTAKIPGDAELWHIHLAARPQMNLRSVGRKRFAHLSENLDEIHVDANIPWGEDTLFTLEFRLEESGKYAIHTCNNKYLSLGGKLVDACTKDCLFSAEYHSGQLALRDRTGAYLSPIGSKAVLKTRSNTVTKDELFSLEDSLPQASFVAALNSKFVSVKQGVDVTANQDEISDHETFQLEFDWTTKRWYIRTMQDKYWTLETGGGIQAAGDKRSSNALFDLAWQDDGSVAFRANNGRYVITKRSGHLYATADVIDDNCKYFFYLVNRPILVLKCDQGFVGYKSSSSPKLECNKAVYETIQVERAEKGIVNFKGQNGKYWHVDSEGVTADSDTPEGFYLELREPTRLSIKTSNGNYLTAGKNGGFRLGDSSIENATQWEY